MNTLQIYDMQTRIQRLQTREYENNCCHIFFSRWHGASLISVNSLLGKDYGDILYFCRKVLCRQQYTSSRMCCTRLNQQGTKQNYDREILCTDTEVFCRGLLALKNAPTIIKDLEQKLVHRSMFNIWVCRSFLFMIIILSYYY